MSFHPSTWDFWIIIGFAGQLCFSARFLTQWIWSEIKKRSVFPIVFWYFSIAGGSILFAYALHRQDPVFIVGQGMGLVVYARNLVLIHRERRSVPPVSEA